MYEGTSHRYTSLGTKVKVICKGQGQISGSCFSKDGCFGGISVSQTHLVIPDLLGPLLNDLNCLHHMLMNTDDDEVNGQVHKLMSRLGVKELSPLNIVNHHIIPVFKTEQWKVRILY